VLLHAASEQKNVDDGVIVSDILNPVFSAVAKGIEDEILPLSYGMILCNSDEDPDRELTFLNMLLSKQVDGIILLPTGENVRFLLSLAAEKFPLVLLDRLIEGMEVDHLLFDNETGAYQATRHLLEQGHKRIGLVSLPMNLTPGRERVSGYDRALRDAGLPYDPALVLKEVSRLKKVQNWPSLFSVWRIHQLLYWSVVIVCSLASWNTSKSITSTSPETLPLLSLMMYLTSLILRLQLRQFDLMQMHLDGKPLVCLNKQLPLTEITRPR